MKNFIKFVDQKGLSILTLMLSDIVWYFLSFLTAYYIRGVFLVEKFGFNDIQPFYVYFQPLPFILVLVITIFYIYGLYQKENRITALNEVLLITRATTFCLLLIMSASFLQKYDYSRVIVILFWASSLVLMNFGRVLVRKIQRYFYKKGIGTIRILIIGAGKWGLKLAEKLKEYKVFGYEVIGFIDNETRPKKESFKFFGGIENLNNVIKRHNITDIYIANPAMSHEKILNLIYQSENLPVRFKVASDLFEIVAGGIDLNEIEGMPTLDLTKQGDMKIYEFLKRLMDLFLSLIMLIVTLPFWLFIICAIKFDTKGPAIFVQERTGQNGKLFKMYKFRTMYRDSDEHAYAPKTNNDKRITRVGQFLRKTSLDELPQLINVLKGQMSLVGPRPEMPFIVAKYKDWQRKRLDVKPGITGLWQVLGRKDLPLQENLEYDFYYIKNRSILLDIVILIKTVSAVLFQKGAY